MSLRVGINAVFLTPLRGGMSTWVIEYLAALCRMEHEFEPVLYGTEAGLAHVRHTCPWAEEIELVAMPGARRAQRPSRIVGELALLPARLRRDRIDLLHSVANIGPLRAGRPHVLTIHDLIYRHYPEMHPGVAHRLIDLVLPRVASRATLIGTPSQASRDDVIELLGVEADRIDVVPMGPGQTPVSASVEGDIRARYRLGDRRVILSIAAGFAHKNVGELLEAFARVGPERDAVLVHVGPALFEGEGWERRARELGIADHVRWAGFERFVTDSELEQLFAAAELLVHPALIEGFGMPPLEAMTRGVPVACSRAPALVEVAGDAVEYFDADSAEQMAGALVNLLDHPARRRELIEAGHRRVAGFSWERTARGYAELYRRAAERQAQAMP